MNVTWMFHDEESRDRIAKRIKALKVEDGEVFQITVKPYEKRRSIAQNARLHLIFSEVAKATGSDVESVKDGYKALFLPGKKVQVLGLEVTRYPKTSRMTVAQLNEFMERCETHAISELGVLIGDGGNYAYA